ncbi:hypothetical protein [Streptomyces sp. NPDC047315]|uniref:hypothetical protein n=1 Tax=Streptomyces sp. NPDC047315 TaxID=3155142 RepID=UPI0033F32BD5
MSLEKKKEKPGPAGSGDGSKSTGPTEPQQADAAKGTTPEAAGADPESGKRFSTRAAREAGYRDGSRAARGLAHVEAYRDGVVDGWGDTLGAAGREKARLDQAHADRKKQRAEAEQANEGAQGAEEESVTTSTPPVVPIEVLGVDGTTLHLGDGAARSTISSGEVRNLRSFQQRLGTRADVLTAEAEVTRGLVDQAKRYAEAVTRLWEAVRAQEAGEHLAARLARLDEDAKAAVTAAEDTHKRALRSAELAHVVVTNSETRYGAMFQAVVDSDETAPARMDFYLEGSDGPLVDTRG